ncbi:MAG: hypothetical protein MUO26_08230, partial [Methanotrichaceae archaeon]|nr:hypothetical protein [Methanotrichaceae archaeon]
MNIKSFAAILLAMGLIASIGCVMGQDKYVQDLAANELANKYQAGLSIPGSEQPIDQGYAPPEVIVRLDPSEIIDQEGYGTPVLNPSAIPPSYSGIPNYIPNISLWIRTDRGYTGYVTTPGGRTLELLVDYAYADKESPGKLLE